MRCRASSKQANPNDKGKIARARTCNSFVLANVTSFDVTLPEFDFFTVVVENT